MALLGRGAAFEGSWFRAEESMAVQNRLAQLVREGKLPSTALAAAEAASSGSAHLPGAFSDVPTTTRGRHQAEWVYQHQKGNACESFRAIACKPGCQQAGDQPVWRQARAKAPVFAGLLIWLMGRATGGVRLWLGHGRV